MDGSPDTAPGARWELYRLLGEPARLRVLALAGEEELAIGELADALGEAQPNVSRHVKPLRQAGLLGIRKDGTRVLVRLHDERLDDPVVRDAVNAGLSLCEEDGSLSRVRAIVKAREQVAREFFERPRASDVSSVPSELPAYLSALAPLIERRHLAVDAGTGDGALLEAIAPVFDRVVAIDRSAAQLALAAERTKRRGYRHVQLLEADYADASARKRIEALGGADAVFAARVLHHAPSPASAIKALARFLAKGGVLVVIDYVLHEDEHMREQQADQWLGFEPAELARFASQAGLVGATVSKIPANRRGDGPDAHLEWQMLVARRPE